MYSHAVGRRTMTLIFTTPNKADHLYPARPRRIILITQSNYIPWKGYFDLIRAADEMILYDEVQFTRRDWRNRNQIKTDCGKSWLTIPVESSSRYYQRVCETRIADPRWTVRHWKNIQRTYAQASYFDYYAKDLALLYERTQDVMLSEINKRFIDAICRWMGIFTPIRWSTEFPRVSMDRTGRLVELCEALGSTHYLSGPAARNYIDEAQFIAAGIQIIYANYTGYPEYNQLHGTFDHNVSALDLLLNTGPNMRKYLIDVTISSTIIQDYLSVPETM